MTSTLTPKTFAELVVWTFTAGTLGAAGGELIGAAAWKAALLVGGSDVIQFTLRYALKRRQELVAEHGTDV